MTEILTSRIQLYKEDFEIEAARVGTKIQTYFAQLIDVIRNRQNQMISELDVILTSYRLERDRIEYLEKLRNDERENCSDPDVDLIQYEILDNIESELRELRRNISGFVEFEWNRKFAREASAIGKLSVRSLAIVSAETPEGSIPEDKFCFTPERKPRIHSQSEDGEILKPTLDLEFSPIFNTDSSSYQFGADITPERFKRFHVDSSPYHPRDTPTKRVCHEGNNSAPEYRTDTTEHVDTAAQNTQVNQCIQMVEARKRSRIDFNGDDFEEEAAQLRINIQTYFSQLSDVISRRQAELISELDLILSNYKLEREKINELEKMKKYHEDLRQSSSVGDMHNDVLARIELELTELKQSTLISVDFEWDRRLAKRIKQTGKLTQKKSIESFDDSGINDTTAVSDVTMKGADSSLFILSKRLYEGLIYKTDVGPIPRDSYREEYLKSPFNNYVYWRVAIEGCYWCGKATNPNQYTYVCDKKCYQYFHEWCRRMLSEFCGEYLCMYPGCDESVVRDVCSETHQNELEKKFKTIHNLSVGKFVLKMPDWYKEDYTKQRSDNYWTVEYHHNQHQQPFLQQQQHLNREDIETEASKIRTKIETYFSQLIDVIKLRKSTLISELDNILSNCRKEREMNRDKMRELEKMRKFHEELYSTSTFNKLQDDFLSRIDTELATLKQTMDSIVIEFEWNQKYASEANNIGKLTCNVIYSAQPLQFRHSSSVSKDTDPIPPTPPRDSNLPQTSKQGTQPNSYTEPQFIKGKANRPLHPDYNNPFD